MTSGLVLGAGESTVREATPVELELIRAVERDDVPAAKAAMAAGADCRLWVMRQDGTSGARPDPVDHTLLHIAADCEAAAVITLLAERGLKDDRLDSRSEYAIHRAAYSDGHGRTTKALLDHAQASMTAIGSPLIFNARNAAECAVAWGNRAALAEMLAHGLDPNLETISTNLLWHAVDHTEVFDLLLEAGADPSACDGIRCLLGNSRGERALKSLYRRGFDITAMMAQQFHKNWGCAMQNEARRRYDEVKNSSPVKVRIVEHLLALGIPMPRHMWSHARWDLPHPDKPLVHAIGLDDPELVGWALERGEDPLALIDGHTVLSLASGKSCDALLHSWISAKAARSVLDEIAFMAPSPIAYRGKCDPGMTIVGKWDARPRTIRSPSAPRSLSAA